MCRACFVEYVSAIGGADGFGADPPAFARALQKELAAQHAEEVSRCAGHAASRAAGCGAAEHVPPCPCQHCLQLLATLPQIMQRERETERERESHKAFALQARLVRDQILCSAVYQPLAWHVNGGCCQTSSTRRLA